MEIGTIVQAKYFNGVASKEESSRYYSLLKQYFTQVGMFAFGQMQFIAKGPDPEKDYDWRNIDCLVDFGEKNHIEVLYNTVINSHENSFPDWYKQLSPEDKEKALEKHIKAVVGRYKEKINTFKLVNEAFRLPEDKIWGTDILRSKLIAKIFAWAKDTYPEGTFILNDHIPFLEKDELRQGYIKLIKGVKGAGGEIDAVGIEGHLGYRPVPFQLPSDHETSTALDEIHEISQCPIHITEFDLSFDNGPTKEYPGSKINPALPFISNGITYSSWFDYQAYAYEHFYNVCHSKNYVEDLVFWGFRDDSKITWERPGTGFINEDFTPKPVLKTFKTILAIAKTRHEDTIS